MLPILKGAAQVPGLLKEVYGDLAKPGVSQVGKALGAVMGLGNTILWPIYLLNEKANLALKNNLEKYRKRMESVSEEEVVEVPPEVGTPIAEKFSYITNDELSDLYIELLAKASTFETAKIAHPSFANVIDNLSPDEAILLKAFFQHQAIPFVEARLENKNRTEWSTLHPLLTGLEVTKGLVYPENIVAYFSNFEGLGIISIRRDIYMAGKNIYEPLEKLYKAAFENAEYDAVKFNPPLFKRYKIEVTPYGRLFFDACMAND